MLRHLADYLKSLKIGPETSRACGDPSTLNVHAARGLLVAMAYWFGDHEARMLLQNLLVPENRPAHYPGNFFHPGMSAECAAYIQRIVENRRDAFQDRLLPYTVIVTAPGDEAVLKEAADTLKFLRDSVIPMLEAKLPAGRREKIMDWFNRVAPMHGNFALSGKTVYELGDHPVTEIYAKTMGELHGLAYAAEVAGKNLGISLEARAEDVGDALHEMVYCNHIEAPAFDIGKPVRAGNTMHINMLLRSRDISALLTRREMRDCKVVPATAWTMDFMRAVNGYHAPLPAWMAELPGVAEHTLAPLQKRQMPALNVA